MKLIFRRADRVTDPESAARILSKHKNSEVEMALDAQSFVGTLLEAKDEGSTLRLKFSWKVSKDQRVEEIDHVQRFAHSRVGNMVRFKAGTDEFVGILTGVTELPAGATVERYLNVPFMLSFAFSAEDQNPVVAFSESSGIVGISVPTNIGAMLPLSPDLPYEPHITVAYFPSLTEDMVPGMLDVIREVAKQVGTFSLRVVREVVFPTPQEDGTYPHVAEVMSEGLHRFHNNLIEGVEAKFPGKVSLEFAKENYRPHVTLKYSKDRSPLSPIKEMAWTADHVTLNLGKTKKYPVPLSRHLVAALSSFFQIGDRKVPVKVLKKGEGSIHVKVEAEDFDETRDIEGRAIKICSGEHEQNVDVLRVTSLPDNELLLNFRGLSSLLPKGAKARLRQIAEMAGERGEKDIEERLLSLSEDEDTEALGPGFEGTDPHIVTYTKSPQTQVIVKSPTFPKSLPLHERI